MEEGSVVFSGKNTSSGSEQVANETCCCTSIKGIRARSTYFMLKVLQQFHANSALTKEQVQDLYDTLCGLIAERHCSFSVMSQPLCFGPTRFCRCRSRLCWRWCPMRLWCGTRSRRTFKVQTPTPWCQLGGEFTTDWARKRSSMQRRRNLSSCAIHNWDGVNRPSLDWLFIYVIEYEVVFKYSLLLH
jgi:hypothetical protein